MADYKHGAHATLERSIVTGSIQTGTVLAYVGVAPVNLVRGYKEKGVVNAPVKVTSLEDAQSKFGMCESTCLTRKATKKNRKPLSK